MEPVTSTDDGIPTWVETLGLSPGPVAPELEALVRLLAQASGVPMAALWIIDGHQQRFAAAHGLNTGLLPAHTTLADRCWQNGDDGLVEDGTGNDPLFAALGLAFFAAVPVHGPERARIGLLCVMDRQPHPVGPARLEPLRSARQLLESHLRLRSDALHDPASGALARRPFVELADREWRRAMRGLYSIGVLVARLDPEAALDREGPEARDRALRAASLVARYSVNRPGDAVCRYDAEHLVLLLPGTDETGALATADRIRRALAALHIPLPGGGGVTLSVAVHLVGAESLSRGNAATAVAHAADVLKRARAEGADRSVRVPPPDEGTALLLQPAS